MEKILSFIVNENKELLLLKGSPNDPQFKKSLWYVVTGGCETIDKIKKKLIEENIPLDFSDCFIKKAEIELDKVLVRKEII